MHSAAIILIVLMVLSSLYMMRYELKLLLERVERYLLKNGKLRSQLAWYFKKKYKHDVELLLAHYQVYQCLEEGLSPFRTYRLFLQTEAWTYERFAKTVSILLYCDLIYPTGHKEANMDYLRYSGNRSVSVADPYYGTISITKGDWQ
jgi:hypothetical protein